MVKLADTYGSGPYAARHEGSNPSLPTISKVDYRRATSRRFNLIIKREDVTAPPCGSEAEIYEAMFRIKKNEPTSSSVYVG